MGLEKAPASAFLGVALALAAAVWLPGGAPAHACGISVRELQEAPIARVTRAAGDVEMGLYQDATAKLSAYADIFVDDQETPNDRAVRRKGERLLARAVAESSGRDIAYGETLEDRGYATPTERVRWAVERLQMILLDDPTDPQLLTDLGVALSKLPSERQRAAPILEGLAGRDLITSAQGWAALARLRGDPKGRAEAHGRCVLMSAGVDRCGPAPDSAPEEATVSDARDGSS